MRTSQGSRSVRAVARLFDLLEGTSSARVQKQSLMDFLSGGDAADLAWALYFLSGKTLKRTFSPGTLRDLAHEITGLPPWLIEKSLREVGDVQEALAVLVGALEPTQEYQDAADAPFSRWIENDVLAIQGKNDPQAAGTLLNGWLTRLSRRENFLLIRILSANRAVELRAAVLEEAISELTGKPVSWISDQLSSEWLPSAAFAKKLLKPSAEMMNDHAAEAMPFAKMISKTCSELTLDGQGLHIAMMASSERVQLIRTSSAVQLWSAIGGRIGATHSTLLDEAVGVPPESILEGFLCVRGSSAEFHVYDVLRSQGQDLRQLPLRDRLEHLNPLLPLAGHSIRRCKELPIDVIESREHFPLLLRSLDSPYSSEDGPAGSWIELHLNPKRFEAVLLYLQGEEEYTFAVWHDRKLVPVARTGIGLREDDREALSAWAKKNTLEKFGPVRSVDPVHVFELECDSVEQSPRHRSGIKLKAPRISRWLKEKEAREASSLDALRELLGRN